MQALNQSLDYSSNLHMPLLEEGSEVSEAVVVVHRDTEKLDREWGEEDNSQNLDNLGAEIEKFSVKKFKISLSIHCIHCPFCYKIEFGNENSFEFGQENERQKLGRRRCLKRRYKGERIIRYTPTN